MARTTKIILHIGSPKTGSSAIQNYLMQYQKRLCLLGYFYPAHWVDANGISAGHAALAAKLKANDLDGAAQWVEKQYSKAQAHNKTLILSSEAFFSESKSLYPILKNVSDNVQVVGYWGPLKTPLKMFKKIFFLNTRDSDRNFITCIKLIP